MIRLNVFIQVNESNRNAALETAKELVAQSLNDNGCIAYDVFESATRKDVLMICETWKDAESLTPHYMERKESTEFSGYQYEGICSRNGEAVFQPYVQRI